VSAHIDLGQTTDALKQALKERTPVSTIEALMYALRSGLSCLQDEGNRDRLRRCDRPAMKEIATRLLDMKRRSNGGRPDWTKEDVAKLLKAWRAVRRVES